MCFVLGRFLDNSSEPSSTTDNTDDENQAPKHRRGKEPGTARFHNLFDQITPLRGSEPLPGNSKGLKAQQMGKCPNSERKEVTYHNIKYACQPNGNFSLYENQLAHFFFFCSNPLLVL